MSNDEIWCNGVRLVPGDKVLFTGQAKRSWWRRLLRMKPKYSPAAQNGIYVVGTGAWTRAGDSEE